MERGVLKQPAIIILSRTLKLFPHQRHDTGP